MSPSSPQDGAGSPIPPNPGLGFIPPSHRRYDFELAHALFGLEMRVITPEWYGGRPVVIWLDPSRPDVVVCTWDAYGCNARVHTQVRVATENSGRAGYAERTGFLAHEIPPRPQGYAPNLPHWARDPEGAAEIIGQMRRRGWFVELRQGIVGALHPTAAPGFDPQRWEARFRNWHRGAWGNSFAAEHSEPGAALARAALAVLGVHVPELEV